MIWALESTFQASCYSGPRLRGTWRSASLHTHVALSCTLGVHNCWKGQMKGTQKCAQGGTEPWALSAVCARSNQSDKGFCAKKCESFSFHFKLRCQDSSVVWLLRIYSMVSGSNPPSAKTPTQREGSHQLSVIPDVGITRLGRIERKGLGYFFLVGYVEERLWWPIQSPNIGKKKKARARRIER